MNNIVIDAVTDDPKGKQMIYITGDRKKMLQEYEHAWIPCIISVTNF